MRPGVSFKLLGFIREGGSCGLGSLWFRKDSDNQSEEFVFFQIMTGHLPGPWPSTGAQCTVVNGADVIPAVTEFVDWQER